MKLSKVAILLWTIQISSSGAFTPSINLQGRFHQGLAMSAAETTADENKVTSKKADRLRFMKNPSFHRRGFKEVREDVENEMKEEYNSALVDELKESKYVMERDGVTVYLAKVCYMKICYSIYEAFGVEVDFSPLHSTPFHSIHIVDILYLNYVILTFSYSNYQ